MFSVVFAIVVVVIGSAIFSGIEAALFSVSPSRAQVLAAQKKRGSEALVIVREKIQRPITVIVIANDLFMVVGSVIVGVIAAGVMNSLWIGITSAIMTALIVIFGEILPKAYGESHSESISLTIARPLLAVTTILAPILAIVEWVTKPFIRKKKIVSEEEIRILSRLGQLEGSIEKDEQEMIQRVFLLNDLTAANIMTPRTVVDALDVDMTLGEYSEQVSKLVHTRLPVYEENLDKIVGVCHQRELLIALTDEGNHSKPIRLFMHEPVFVPKNMRSDELLPFFQKKKRHLAVVVDEFGGTSGIVTLEDVLEQLVGEIVDEHDKVQDMRVRAKKLLMRKIHKDKKGLKAEDILE